MMKKLYIAALTVILIAGMMGCRTDTDIECPPTTSTEYPWSITESNMDIKNNNEHIVFQIVDGTLTPKGAQVELYNNGQNTISFGSKYYIQIYTNNSWCDIEIGSIDWTAELFTVEADCKYTADLDWCPIYGEIPSGKYRIIKEYKQNNQQNLTFCEFEIP